MITEYRFSGFGYSTEKDRYGHEVGEDYVTAIITVGKNYKRVDVRLTEEQVLNHIAEAVRMLLLLRTRARRAGMLK